MYSRRTSRDSKRAKNLIGVGVGLIFQAYSSMGAEEDM